jgi:branched-chain amino acid transport system ATP-binding protein
MTLALTDISKRLGGMLVLDGLSFSADLDAMTGIIGPNGAGKSTLFAVISGFQNCDTGSTHFGGQSFDGLRPEQRVRKGLARTFQTPRPFTHLTVRENLAVGAQAQSGERLVELFFRPWRIRAQDKRIFERADATIDFLGLGPVANHAAGQISGGQRKLLELGRALMTEPRYILLDEPFAGVNPVLIEQISQRIHEAKARGIGFLIVEHDLSALSRLVSRLLVMDRGRLIADGAPDQVLEDRMVQEAYMGGAVS